MTTELALAGTPMVVGYRIGAVTYAILKRLFTPPYITLFNIAAGREIAPELVQADCTGEKLSAQVARLLDDAEARERQVAEQTQALAQMGRGGPDPSEAAAQVVLQMVGRA